jgi:hypothetical protein
MAKPYNYTDQEKEAIITDICNRVIEEKISFNKAVEDSSITYVTFFNWMTKSEALKELYNYARNIRSDVLFEEIIEIADTTEIGEVTVNKPSGIEVKTGDMIHHRQLKIDARKWVVSKMQPKKYGDKLDLSSSDGTMTPNIINLDALTTEELLLRAKAAKELTKKEG